MKKKRPCRKRNILQGMSLTFSIYTKKYLTDREIG